MNRRRTGRTVAVLVLLSSAAVALVVLLFSSVPIAFPLSGLLPPGNVHQSSDPDPAAAAEAVDLCDFVLPPRATVVAVHINRGTGRGVQLPGDGVDPYVGFTAVMSHDEVDPMLRESLFHEELVPGVVAFDNGLTVDSAGVEDGPLRWSAFEADTPGTLPGERVSRAVLVDRSDPGLAVVRVRLVVDVTP